MKKLLFILCAFILNFNPVHSGPIPKTTLLINGNGTNLTGKKASTRLPQKCTNYLWDSATNSWKLNTLTTMQYNLSGKLINQVVQGKYVNNKTTNVVDSAGNIIGIYKFKWDSLQQTWDTTDITIATYGIDSLILSQKTYSLDLTDTMRIVEDHQYIYTKDPNKLITELLVKNRSLNSTTYQNLYLYKYGYDNNSAITNIESFFWHVHSNTFKKEELFSNIQWHKYVSTFNNSLLAYLTATKWKDTNYIDSYKLLRNYDSRDNVIELKDDIFNFNNNNKWMTSSWYTYEHTYDTDGTLLETIENAYDSKKSAFVKIARKVYSDFFMISSLDEQQTQQTKINVYPSPVKSGGTLHIPSPNVASIVIYSATGVLIQTSTVEDSTVQLQTNLIPKQLCYYQLFGKNKELLSTGKLLIE